MASAVGFSSKAKRIIIIVHDLVMTLFAISLALFLRFPVQTIPLKLDALGIILPLFVAYAAVVFRIFPLYKSKWRFASLPDLFNIFQASVVLAISLLALDYGLVARNIFGGFLFGEKTALLFCFLEMMVLGGPRIAYRYLKFLQAHHARQRDDVPQVLILGRATEADIALRALEGGLRHRFFARGILSPRESDLGAAIRGVPVIGSFDDLERVIQELSDLGHKINRVIFAPSEFLSDSQSEKVLAAARRLGLALSRLETVDDGSSAKDAITPLEIEDLLFRPSVEIDKARVAEFLRGKRVIVTGGGGSIGSEICQRLMAFHAAELLVLDNSEPALFAIGEALTLHQSPCVVTTAIADVRDRARIFSLFHQFAPDLVFHAAALKQVPQLELDWAEGIKTNIFGSVNVADAAVACHAGVVMISTDKAVDPVSVLGATKRMSEIYAQMLDSGQDSLRDGNQDKNNEKNQDKPSAKKRLISVRFGNVLGSVGSVVPKFKAQIARGGPVTVTHPDMVRYFMTVREAVDLVLLASAHSSETAATQQADQPSQSQLQQAASVYVLKMGQPARIADLAYKMIRLAGYEPNVDIPVIFTGTRKGERLNEVLFASNEPIIDVNLPGITAAKTTSYDRAQITSWLERLQQSIDHGKRTEADGVFAEAIPAYARFSRPANVVDIATRRA